MAKTGLSKSQVNELAVLANLHLSDELVDEFLPQFGDILELMSQIQSLDTKGLEQTNQVTGLTNVFREDKIEKNRMFSQKEALKNANNTHNGYFVVDQLIEE